MFLEALASLGVGMSVTKSHGHTLEVLASLGRSCIIFTELGSQIHSPLCSFFLFQGLVLFISILIPLKYINNSHKPTYSWLKVQIVNTFPHVRCYDMGIDNRPVGH